MALSVILNQMKNATQSHTRSDWSVLFLSKLNLHWSHNSNPMHWPRSLCSLTEVDIQTHRFDCGNPCTGTPNGRNSDPFCCSSTLSTLSVHINLRALVKVARTSQSRLGRMVNWVYEHRPCYTTWHGSDGLKMYENVRQTVRQCISFFPHVQGPYTVSDCLQSWRVSPQHEVKRSKAQQSAAALGGLTLPDRIRTRGLIRRLCCFLWRAGLETQNNQNNIKSSSKTLNGQSIGTVHAIFIEFLFEGTWSPAGTTTFT